MILTRLLQTRTIILTAITKNNNTFIDLKIKLKGVLIELLLNIIYYILFFKKFILLTIESNNT